MNQFVSRKQRVHILYSVFVCSKNKSVYLRVGTMDDKILILMLFVSVVHSVFMTAHVGFEPTENFQKKWDLGVIYYNEDFIVNS